MVKIIALTGTLSNTSKDRESSVLLGNVVDKLHDKHGLTDTGTSEKTNLTSTSVWVNKVNNLDTGYKNLSLGLLLSESWSISVNWKSTGGINWSTLVNWLSNNVDNPAKKTRADWHLDWGFGVNTYLAANETIGGVHSNGTNGVLSKMLGDLKNNADIVILNLKSVQDRWELAIKLNVNNGANDLSHATLGWAGSSGHGAAGADVCDSCHGGTTTKC
jgi:hypothetical protein